MYRSNSQTDAPSAPIFDVQCSLMHAKNIVDDEPCWRVPRQTSAMAISASKVVATRWHAGSDRTQEFGAETPADCHIVKIVLRNMNIRFRVSDRTVHDGVTTPGMVHVTELAVTVRCLFRGPYDVLHLHVPNNLIAECARDMIGHPVPVLCSKSVPRKDITVDSLGRALLEADRVGGSFGQLYADCVSIAIVARLLASATRSQRNFGQPRVCGLTNTCCAAGSSGLKRCSPELACRWWTSRCRSASRPRHTSPAFSNATRGSHRARGASPVPSQRA
jgi:hypothetical protein